MGEIVLGYGRVCPTKSKNKELRVRLKGAEPFKSGFLQQQPRSL